jgi:hypothetical protein
VIREYIGVSNDWQSRGRGFEPLASTEKTLVATIATDGQPCMTAVGAFRVEGRYCFCGGPRSHKIWNIESDPRCRSASPSTVTRQVACHPDRERCRPAAIDGRTPQG